MIASTWLVETATTLVVRYGLFATFAFMVLETSLLFPFAPSEVVLPVAAALLVDGPVGFAAFVVSATVGSIVGSLVAYYLFGRGGERAILRYGRYVHLSRSEVERGCRWFHRWGESSVLWGRFLPLVRSVVSVPAGMAHMSLPKFVLYTAVGTSGFVSAVAYSTIRGIDLLGPLF